MHSADFELNELINNSWDGIGIIDKQTKFVYVNDAFSPLLGFSKEEIKGVPFIGFVKQEYKKSFLKLLKDNIENSYNTDMNLICLRKDKEQVYFKITVSLMRNKKYFVVNAKDITKEISDDEILNNYVLSFHTSTLGQIQSASQAFCKLSGYKEEELKDKPFSFLMHKDEDPAIFNKVLEQLGLKHEVTQRIHYAKSNGDPFYVDMTMKPIYNKYGDITGYTSLMFDVTTELVLDQKLAIENSKLEIMADTIRTISHEWRQPLNIISLKAQALQFELEDTEVIGSLEDIKVTSKELSETIEDFQNIMKSKSEKIPCEIDNLIAESINSCKQLADAKVNITVDNSIDTLIMLNRKELVSIFQALYINSCEAFIRNFIEDRTIEVKAYTKKTKIHFVFTDNAGGITQEVLSNIFNPYYSTKEQCHGVGLGLYMCKMIIQMHLGGTIEVLSKNQSTTFDITLPIDLEQGL